LTGPGREAEIESRSAARTVLLQDWTWVPDGGAAQRVVEVIHKMVGVTRAEGLTEGRENAF